MTKPPRDRCIPDLMTLVDAARRLRMSRQALHKAAAKGQILGAEIGQGVWVFRRAVVEVEARKRGISPEHAERTPGHDR